MPWKVEETSALLEQHDGSLEAALNAAEQDGWELRFIRPAWSIKTDMMRIHGDETFLFHKPA